MFAVKQSQTTGQMAVTATIFFLIAAALGIGYICSLFIEYDHSSEQEVPS